MELIFDSFIILGQFIGIFFAFMYVRSQIKIAELRKINQILYDQIRVQEERYREIQGWKNILDEIV